MAQWSLRPEKLCQCVPKSPDSAVRRGQPVLCDCSVLGKMENLGPAWNRILWKSCFILGWDQNRSLDWESQAGF